MSKKNIHFVGHTHWDREWYFSVRDSFVLLSESFKRVVEVLESNETDSFCLDGQSSILEDFLNFHPDYKERVEKLIADKRLFVGPWFTQTDCLYVSGDSIVQNIVYGSKYANAWGHNMNVAYLPDTFGFNVQMPTIIRNCGIDNAIIRRGVDYDVHKTDSYFKWRGLSGKEVLTAHIYRGYGEIGQIFNAEGKEERIDKYIEKIAQYTTAGDILVESGGDQTEINATFNEDMLSYKILAEKYNLMNSNLEKFFDAIKDRETNSYTSDFRIGSYDRVHRTIGSVRYDIKVKNYQLENKIFNLVLPMMLIGKMHSIDFSYKLIDVCFGKLFENQAHDSMGGCVVDEVYDDILYRFKEVEEILDGIANSIAYRIHEQGHYSEQEIILFNTDTKISAKARRVEVLSYDKNVTLSEAASLISCVQVEDNSAQGHHYDLTFLVNTVVQALGYKVITIVESNEASSDTTEITEVNNNLFNITFNDDTLMLEYNGVKYENFISMLDMGNDGDTYDFAYLLNEIELPIQFTNVKMKRQNELSTIEGFATAELPVDLDSRLNNGPKEKMNFKLVLEILDNQPNIEVKIQAENTVLSHRLRAVFNFGKVNENHIKSVPFGYMKKANEEAPIENWKKTHQEENLNIQVLDNSVSLFSNQNVINVISKGCKEYEMTENGLAITLFASTGDFGRANLTTRPGRASGDTSQPGHKAIYTPKAQYLGKLEFEFFVNFVDEFDADKLFDLTKEVRTPIYNYQRQKIDKFAKRLDNKMFPIFPSQVRKEELSLFELDLHVSYIDFQDGRYIVRIVNPSEEPINVEVKLSKVFSKVETANALLAKQPLNYVVEANDFATFICER